MAKLETYLVPVDFSRSSKAALDYAVELIREGKGRLVVVHVFTDSVAEVPFPMRERYYAELREEVRRKFWKLRLDRKLSKKRYRFVILTGQNAGQLIASEAKRSRATMIVMGSHGRSGLGRLVLGSVAEKTIRYAGCPVLVVKR